MEQYHITGMSCAACQNRVEKAVSSLPGVTACSVNLLTNSMGVTGSASEEEIIRAVEKAGYGAVKKGKRAEKAAAGEEQTDTQTKQVRGRLIASLVLLVPLMYVSMGHMWKLPLPEALGGNPMAVGILELLLAGLIMVINQRFFISGTRGLLHGAPNMDTLVALGSAASFGYSVYALFAMSSAMLAMDHAALHAGMGELYFESAAMILTLITVGKLLEAKSKGRTTDALRGLMKLAPKTAVILRNGSEEEVPVEQVRPGDRFVVKPGSSIPMDGVVLQGFAAVDESALTGESIPVEKAEGAAVSAATLNQSGVLVCEATRVGEDTSLAQIIRMVSDAAATKAPIAKAADRVAGVFVPVVMGIAAVTFLCWMMAGESVGFALARAVSVLVISCPCSLGLATPVAIMVGSGVGAKNGILFKTAVSLEETGKVRVVALDKTGTITRGEPVVQEVLAADSGKQRELLQTACSLEQNSNHPLARAVTAYAGEKGFTAETVENFTEIPGNGLSAELGGKKLLAGNRAFLEKNVKIPDAFFTRMEEQAELGRTPLFFARGGEFLGMICVADAMKEDSAQAVSELKKMGIRVVMLTGDNEKTAEAIGRQAGVTEVVAGVLPQEKAETVRKLRRYGKVAMVGDGINDAPALTEADMGIAIGAGTEVALDAADVVLMKSSLLDAAAAIRISRATLKNIHENLFWAFFYNVIGIPLAAGLWIPVFGWTLSPMFGAAAMSLSSVCVVANALRLNLCRVYANKSKKEKNKEEQNMVIMVKGMMCAHCEAHVKAALEAVEGVISAKADHAAGTVSLETDREISEAVLSQAVKNAGYEYAGKKEK